MKKVKKLHSRNANELPQVIIETDRLILRQLTVDDAEFILELLNDPGWLRYIGDRGIRNLADARQYIVDGPVASYQRNGFGLYLVESKDSKMPMGICGLIQREELEDVDIGFAFLPQFGRKGFAFEAASAVMDHAAYELGIQRIVAITSWDNLRSIKLLEKLGMQFQEIIKLSEDDPGTRLFVPG